MIDRQNMLLMTMLVSGLPLLTRPDRRPVTQATLRARPLHASTIMPQRRWSLLFVIDDGSGHYPPFLRTRLQLTRTAGECRFDVCEEVSGWNRNWTGTVEVARHKAWGDIPIDHADRLEAIGFWKLTGQRARMGAPACRATLTQGRRSHTLELDGAANERVRLALGALPYHCSVGSDEQALDELPWAMPQPYSESSSW